MKQVVSSLEKSQLAALDNISNSEHMLASLKPLTTRNWYAVFLALQERWANGDAELQHKAEANRRALKI
jgi:hypothetical protein